MRIITNLQIFKSFFKCGTDSDSDLILRGSLVYSNEANVVRPDLVARPEAVILCGFERPKYTVYQSQTMKV